jgi:hypothetical protein
MKISFILKSIVAFFAMISMNVFAQTTTTEAITEHMFVSSLIHADFADLITGAANTANHNSTLAIASSKNVFTGTLSANDNSGFTVELKGLNGALKNADGPDIDYTIVCPDITVSPSDAAQLGSSNQTTSSKLTATAATNLSANTNVELYVMDGGSGNDALPQAGLVGEEFVCVITPITTNFTIGAGLDGNYTEVFTLTLTGGD